MRNILIVGAGKSTSVLVDYLLKKSECENLFLTIGDLLPENARKMIGKHPRAKVINLNIFKKEEREAAVEKADLVISMLPAQFHIEVANLRQQEFSQIPEYL